MLARKGFQQLKCLNMVGSLVSQDIFTIADPPETGGGVDARMSSDWVKPLQSPEST